MDLRFLPDLVAEALGASQQMIAYEMLADRPDYCVVVVQLAPPGAKLSIKLAGPEAPRWASAQAFERAALLSRLVREQGVTVPEVLAVDTTCTRWPVRYLIATFLAGETWISTSHRFDETDRQVVFAELGSAVARIHSLTFDAFGDLDPSGTVQGGSSYVDALRKRAAQRIPRYLGLFESLIQKHRDVLDEVAQPRLTHEDLNPTNLLVANNGQNRHLAGVLDFDSVWAGNAESDAELGTDAGGDVFE
jgi:aminoglycoside phosphotransferase (APT) family kinase protein